MSLNIKYTYFLLNICEPEGIRTPNLLIRNQVHYPVMLQVQFSFEFRVLCFVLIRQMRTDNRITNCKANQTAQIITQHLIVT